MPRQPDVGALYRYQPAGDPAMRRPLVTLPGTLGSRLRDGPEGAFIWGGPDRLSDDPTTPDGLRRLALPVGRGTEPLSQLADGVHVDGVLREARAAVFGAPVAQQVYESGLGPYFDDQIGLAEALDGSIPPVRGFLLAQTRESDLELFYELGDLPDPQTPEDVSMPLLVPAFVISELRTAFEMGFMLFLPFLLLDLVVASVLMSMGMVMLPPALVSLPIKVMLFVVADGWHMIAGSLVRSFA
ncbi:MAG: hypothetical protein AAF658_12720 [Myxococcota bacterium]